MQCWKIKTAFSRKSWCNKSFAAVPIRKCDIWNTVCISDICFQKASLEYIWFENCMGYIHPWWNRQNFVAINNDFLVPATARSRISYIRLAINRYAKGTNYHRRSSSRALQKYAFGVKEEAANITDNVLQTTHYMHVVAWRLGQAFWVSVSGGRTWYELIFCHLWTENNNVLWYIVLSRDRSV